MALVRLTADVYCHRSEGGPSYRIYVDDEMLTERSWIWPAYETFVRELVEVDVAPGAHRLKIVECNCHPVFELRDITANGEPIAASGVFFV
jgi:hypothetical protein